MRMAQALYDEMIAHVQRLWPEEACGLIAGLEDQAVRLYPIDNILRSSTAYEMEPLQQLEAMLGMEADGWELLGIYHSHPYGPAAPSRTDLAQAYYPDAQYVIVSLLEWERPEVRAFYLIDGKAQELPFVVSGPHSQE